MDPYSQNDQFDSIPKADDEGPIDGREGRSYNPRNNVEEFHTDQDGSALVVELGDFWDAIRPWLATKGVNLYTLGILKSQLSVSNPWKHWYTPLVSNTAPLPYAECVDMEVSAARSFRIPIQLACAQDDAGRDLMLKLVDKDSDQYRIYEWLLQDWDIFCDSRTFPCVLPPVDILDTPHSYSIVTMPTWGDYIKFDMSNVGEVLRFMKCLLDGLVFLHSKRIAHRDICDNNMVVNCYRRDRDQGRLAEDLCEHCAGDDVFYALMDYDQSIQLPDDASLKHCCRPSEEAWTGSEMYRPTDAMLGEPEYNPFAYDVAMLGNLFRVQFTQAVVAVPALAALYDKMTTHVLSERFTAVEARQFLEDATSNSPHGTARLSICLHTGMLSWRTRKSTGRSYPSRSNEDGAASGHPHYPSGHAFWYG